MNGIGPKLNKKDKYELASGHLIPEITDTQVLVKVKYAGVNRADLLQRKGAYPPPPGVSEILGLEFSGEIVKLGKKVKKWSPGEQVCGIVGGGAYAEFVKIEDKELIKVPGNITLEEAGGIPEAFLTAYQGVSQILKVNEGESILIHAAASGVGSAAIQIAKKMDLKIYCTASKAKHDYCRNLGADVCIDYKSEKFDEVIESKIPGGVNHIIDFIGADYFQQNLNALSLDGKMVMFGFLGGVKTGDLNLASIIRKRLLISGSTLRNRSSTYKANLVQDFVQSFLGSGEFSFRTNIDKTFSWQDMEEAHQYMAENRNKGKIVLRID